MDFPHFKGYLIARTTRDAGAATACRNARVVPIYYHGQRTKCKCDVAGRSEKKALRPAQRKQLVGHLIDRYRVSVNRACQVCQQSRAGWYQKLKPKVLDVPLKVRMHEIASTRVRFGFWRIYVLIRRDGWVVNHKRVYRLYKEEGLNLRSKRPHRRKAAAHRLERPTLSMANQSWSMDFVSDHSLTG